MVEILSGVITGSGISHDVASLYKSLDRESNAGHLFMAIDIRKLMPLDEYFERIKKLIHIIKQVKTMEGFDEVLIPGETRWRNFEKQKKDGIELEGRTVQVVSQVANELGVSVPW